MQVEHIPTLVIVVILERYAGDRDVHGPSAPIRIIFFERPSLPDA